MLKKPMLIAALLGLFSFASTSFAARTDDYFFQGSLVSKPIWINLSAAMAYTETGPEISGDLSGVYGYGLYDGREIRLTGKADDSGNFTLHEQDQDGKQTASWTGQIDMSTGTIKGTWHNAANTKSYPITATLKGMSESIAINQAVPKEPGDDSCCAGFHTASSTLTLPYFIDPEYQGFNRAINQKLLKFTEDALKDKGGYLDERYEIRALAPTYAVILNQVYGYSFGAAHGGSSQQHLVFTRTNPQQAWHQLTFADISAGNPHQCLPKLRALMIAKLQKANAGSPESLEAKDIPNLDFLPSPEGIHFYFSVYQVGSFAEGIHHVLLRYNQTQGCLKRPANYPGQ